MSVSGEFQRARSTQDRQRIHTQDREVAGLDGWEGGVHDAAVEAGLRRAVLGAMPSGTLKGGKPVAWAAPGLSAGIGTEIGLACHRRFLADAAHELRTPIAILSTRVASLEPGPEKTYLLEDATRLSVMAGQLLDLQRLDQQADTFAAIDLVAVARQVVLDLAPLAFAAGYEMSFEHEDETTVMNGDQTSIERALTNLVQNAIDHGRRRGTILVRVTAAGLIEVCDDGDGIPPDEREQILEPFRRLHPGGRGAGLGLDLVQEQRDLVDQAFRRLGALDDDRFRIAAQALFLGLRVTGQAAAMQIVWIYEHPVDWERLRQFHQDFGYGLAGRLIEPSVLPFGRHRWVAALGPAAPLDVAAEPRPRAELSEWIDEFAQRPLDPEHGPLIAVKLNILTRKTLGGFETDLDSRVFGNDHQIISGLYAAGEIGRAHV